MIKISVLTSLYNCKAYLSRFFENVLNIENLYETEFVFIHNAPSQTEKEIICSFLKAHTHINPQYIEVPREGLYASWNRAIKMAKGEFVAVWNVDDIRLPNSLKIQADEFTKHIKVDLVYGNKYAISHLGDDKLRHEITKNITKNKCFFSFQEGAFLMWRISIHKYIGYFDEQYVIAGDADFWFRVAEKHKIVKTEAILGIYLREKGKGISKTAKTGALERLILCMRYGFYPRLVPNPFLLPKAFKKLNPRLIHSFGKTHKRPILKYKHPMLYIMSAFTLIFVAIPFTILGQFLDLTQYNYHYFKNLIRFKKKT